MDYNDVPLFVRVVDAGSFTAAADALGLPKSSVSRSVARLEEDLGVRLLQRTTRKLSLTDAGQAFFERVRGAVVGVDEAADAVRELGGDPRGAIRITAPPDAYILGVADAVTEFVQKYPGIRVEFSLTSRRVDLIAEGFDLAIRAGVLDDSSLVVRKVGTAPLVMFAAPSYLREHGTPKSLSELAQHECVLFRAHGGKATWTFKGPKGEESVDVQGKISVDEMAFLSRLCIAGAGIAMFPVVLAREAIERKQLEPLLPEYRLSGGAVHIVLPTATFVPTRVALLRDFLVERLGKEITETERLCDKHRKKAS